VWDNIFKPLKHFELFLKLAIVLKFFFCYQNSEPVTLDVYKNFVPLLCIYTYIKSFHNNLVINKFPRHKLMD